MSELSRNRKIYRDLVSLYLKLCYNGFIEDSEPLLDGIELIWDTMPESDREAERQEAQNSAEGYLAKLGVKLERANSIDDIRAPGVYLVAGEDTIAAKPDRKLS